MKLIIWHVWCCVGRHTNRFFESREDAVHHIKLRYGNVRLHPNEDDDFHVWTRENYGGTWHHPDGHNLWVAWVNHCMVHLERHEIEPSVNGVTRALNTLPRLSR